MLIMFIGLSESGKTTLANMLVKRFGFVLKNFADPLKAFAISIGFTQEQVYGTQAQKLEVNKFWGISGREFLQLFGTDVCRNALPKAIPNMQLNGKQLWARVMDFNIEQYPNLVIGDGRFIDEATQTKEHNGIIIRVVRDSIKSKLNPELAAHRSEVESNEIVADHTIYNNGTLDDLEQSLMKILSSEGFNLDAKF